MLCSEVAALPVATLLVGVVDGLVLVVSGSEATLVSIWPCVTVVGEVMNGVLLVGSGVAASEGVGLLVGITVLVLLVVLSPVEKKVLCIQSSALPNLPRTYILIGVTCAHVQWSSFITCCDCKRGGWRSSGWRWRWWCGCI